MKTNVNPCDVYEYTFSNINEVPEKIQDEALNEMKKSHELAKNTIKGLKTDFIALQVIAHISERASEMQFEEIMKFSAIYYELKKSNNAFLVKLGEVLGESINTGFAISTLLK